MLLYLTVQLLSDVLASTCIAGILHFPLHLVLEITPARRRLSKLEAIISSHQKDLEVYVNTNLPTYFMSHQLIISSWVSLNLLFGQNYI